VEGFPADTRVVKVRVKDRWCCALLDLSTRVSVEAPLIRMAIATDHQDCADCDDVDA
jgi:hypothetical protein